MATHTHNCTVAATNHVRFLIHVQATVYNTPLPPYVERVISAQLQETHAPSATPANRNIRPEGHLVISPLAT